MQLIISFIIYQLVQLKTAAKVSVLFGAAFYGFMKSGAFMEKFLYFSEVGRPGLFMQLLDYLVENESYILIVLFTIAIDHLLGTWKHIKLRNFNIKQNIGGFFTKFFIACLGAALFEAMGVIIHQDSVVKEYLIIVTRLIVFLYPARSAFRSMSTITNGKFPPKKWISKIEKFEGTLDPAELGNKKD